MLNYKRGQKIYKKQQYIQLYISAKRFIRVLRRDEPVSTQTSVRIGVLLSSCARTQVISMIDAYSLGKQANHAGRS